jgi:TP901 family phage tail tape measure protein
VNDILKVIVDAELKKNTNLEKSLDSIKENYSSIEIDVKVKGGQIEGLDGKSIEQLKNNIEALQGKVNQLGNKAGKGIDNAFKGGKKDVENMSKAVDGLLKRIQKVNAEGAKTHKNTQGDGKFKSTTTTTGASGEFISEETVENFKEVNKIYDKMLSKSKEWKSINKEEEDSFKKMLKHLKKIQIVSGGDAGTKIEFGSKKFLKQVERVQKEYEKLEVREKTYQNALKSREKIEEKLGRFKNREDNLLTNSDYKKLNEELYGDGKRKGGLVDLKTAKGVEGRLEKINGIIEEMIQNNKELNSEMAKMEKHESYKDDFADKKDMDESKNLQKSADELKKQRDKNYQQQEKDMIKHEEYKENYLEKQEEEQSKLLNKQAEQIKKDRDARYEQEERDMIKHEEYKLKYKDDKAMQESIDLQRNADNIKKQRDKAYREQEKDMVKRMEKMHEKNPFVDERLNKIKDSGFVNNDKEDFIKSDQFEKVDSLFKQVNKKASQLGEYTGDFNVELKKAEQELAKLEKHAQGLSNLQDAQNDVRKKMNLDIKKARTNEDADNMSMRNIVPKELIDDFKKLNEALSLDSTKMDIEEVAKEYRRLVGIEKELKKAKTETEKQDILKQKALEKLQSDTRQLSKELEEVDYNSSRAFDKSKISTENYQKVRNEIEELNKYLVNVKNTQTEMSKEQKDYAQSRIKEIKRQEQSYRDLKKAIDDAHSEALREEKRRSNLGDNRTSPDDFDFGVIKDNDVRGNQERIRDEIKKTINALHEQDEAYGKLDENNIRVKRSLDQLGNEIYRVNYTVDRGNREFEDFTLNIDSANREIRDLGRNMRVARGEMSQLQQLGVALEKVPVWAMATGIVYGAMSQFQQGFEMLLSFDKAMVNLSKVTDGSREELESFRHEAVTVGKELGITADEVVRSTTEFSRLGYSLQESKGLAENALVYANVGDMTVEDASESMISALKGFGVAQDEAVRKSKEYSDIFNEVGNNYAISADGIGEALKRSSAILHQSGNSIEQSVALITSANTTIQNPRVVGTALKTIAMRLRGVDEEGNKVATLVPELEQYFNRFGSTIMESEDTFKSTYDIMGELAENWQNLSDIQQAQITELIGGKRQGSIVSSMIENWADATGSYESALNSAGSAQREFAKYQEGFEFRIGRLKGAMEEFWNAFFDEETVKGAVDGLTVVVELLTQITEFTGMLPALTTMFLTFGLMANKNLRKFVATGEGLTKIRDIIKDIGKAGSGLVKMIMRFAKVSLPILAITTVIELLVGWYLKAKRADEERLKTMRDEYAQTQEMITAYNQLKEAGDMDRYSELTSMNPKDMGIEERQELLALQEKLNGISGSVIDHYNEEGEAVYKSAEAIDALVEAKRKEQEANAPKLAREEIEQFDYGDNLIMNDEGITKTVESFKHAQEELALIEKRNNSTGISILQSFFDKEFEALKDNPEKLSEAVANVKDKIKSELSTEEYMEWAGSDGGDILNRLRDGIGSPEEVEELMNQYVSSLEDQKGKINEKLNGLKSDLESQTSNLKSHLLALGREFANNNDIDLNSNEFMFIKKFAENYTKGMAELEAGSDEFTEYLSRFPEAVKDVMKDMESDEYKINIDSLFEGKGDMSQIDKLKELAKSYGDSSAQGEVLASIIRMLTEEYNLQKDAVDGATESFILSESKLADMNKKYETAISNIGFLQDAQAELNSEQGLGADTLGELINRYPSLIQYMGDEVAMSNAVQNALVDEQEIARQVLNNKLMYNEQFYQKSLKTHSSFFTELGKTYKLDLDGWKNLAQAKASVEEQLINRLSGAWSSYFQQASDGLVKLNREGQMIMNQMDRNIEKAYNSLNPIQQVVSGPLLHHKSFGNELRTTKVKINMGLVDIAKGFDNITMPSINAGANFSGIGGSSGSGGSGGKGGSGGGSGSGSDVPDPDHMDTMDAWLRQKHLRNERMKMQEEEIQNKIEIYEQEENFRKAISSTNTLIKKRTDRMGHLTRLTGQLEDKMRAMYKSNSWSDEKWLDENGEVTSFYVNKYNARSKSEQEKMDKHLARLQKVKKQMIENREEIDGMSNSIRDLGVSLEELKIDRLQKHMDTLTESIEETRSAFSRLKTDLEREFAFLEDDDTAGRTSLIMKRLDLLAKERKMIEENIKRLKQQRTYLTGHEELLKQNTESIRDFESQLKDINVEVINSQREMKDMYNELADVVIDQYKEAIERQQDAELEGIDNLLEAEDERHEKRMEHLDEEMNAFEEQISKQLEAIDKQEDEDDFQRQLDKKQEERQKVLDEMNKYANDNTASGRLKMVELEEELAKKEEEIEQFLHDRQIELRKNSLNEQLESKRDQIEDLKDEENNYHEDVADQYDEERDMINKHYSNLLEDERRWNKIRQDIMNENFSAIQDDFKGFAESVKEMSEEIGVNLSQNIIDKLKETSELMDKLGDPVLGEQSKTPDYSGDAGDMGTLSESDYKLMGAKFLNDKMLGYAKTQGQRNGLKVRINDWSQSARREGSTLDPDNDRNFDEILEGMTEKERLLSAKYLRHIIVPDIETPALKQQMIDMSYKIAGEARETLGKDFWLSLTFEEALKKHTLGLETGGYTGEFKGGRVAMLHEKELVLNKIDTKNILDAVSMVRDFKSILPIFKQPQVATPNIHNSDNSTGETVVNINIERLEGGEEGAKTLTAKFSDALKRRGVKK